MIQFIKNMYHPLLWVLLFLLLTRCCPGAKNLAYPHIPSNRYTALDLTYKTSLECLLSKLDEFHETAWGYKGIINRYDDIFIETNESQVNFVKLIHNDNYENLYAKWNYYKWKLHTYGIIYQGDFRFSSEYRNNFLTFQLGRYGLTCTINPL